MTVTQLSPPTEDERLDRHASEAIALTKPEQTPAQVVELFTRKAAR